MKIYNYDKNTKEFLFSSYAQKNPKRKNEYIFPKNSTTVIPPETGNLEVAVFNGKYWDIVPDFRGLEKIDVDTKEVFIIDKIGRLEDGFALLSFYSCTDDYKDYIREQKNDAIKANILANMKKLDEKRVRAICEPSVKDEETGETWLEYYNSEMDKLRKELLGDNYDA